MNKNEYRYEFIATGYKCDKSIILSFENCIGQTTKTGYGSLFMSLLSGPSISIMSTICPFWFSIYKPNVWNWVSNTSSVEVSQNKLWKSAGFLNQYASSRDVVLILHWIKKFLKQWRWISDFIFDDKKIEYISISLFDSANQRVMVKLLYSLIT